MVPAQSSVTTTLLQLQRLRRQAPVGVDVLRFYQTTVGVEIRLHTRAFTIHGHVEASGFCCVIAQRCVTEPGEWRKCLGKYTTSKLI